MNFFDSFNLNKLPTNNYLLSLLKKTLDVFDSEVDVEYRPKSNDENLGGFLQFDDDLPTILVPDLHARYNFLKKLLAFKKLPNQNSSVYVFFQNVVHHLNKLHATFLLLIIHKLKNFD